MKKVLLALLAIFCGCDNFAQSHSCWQQVSSISDGYSNIIKTNSGTYLCNASTVNSLYSSSDLSFWSPVSSSFPSSAGYVLGKDKSGKLFISTAHNGIYESSDNGTTWQYSFGSGYGCAAGCFATDDIDNIYVGLGGYLRGMYISTDTGNIWSNNQSGMDFINIDFFPAGNFTYAINTNNQVWLSSNNGATWLQITGQPFSSNAIAVNHQGDTVYIVCNNGNIYRSLDLSVSWMYYANIPITNTASVYNNTIIFAGSNKWWIEMSASGIWQSNDNGMTWQENDSCISGNVNSLFHTGDTVYATTTTGIFRYIDCLSPTVSPIIGLSSAQIGSNVLLIDSTSGGVWSSSNASIATVSASGVITGVASGSATISYTVSNSCGSSTATHAMSITAPIVPSSSCPKIITTVAGNGISGYSGDGGAATSASLSQPFGLAVDGSGNLYFADEYNNVIRKVSPSGTISTVAGNGVAGYSGDGGAATSANLNDPIGVAVDGSGNLFIGEPGNNVIRKVSPSGTISTVAGNGSGGYSGDGGAATSAILNGPCGIAIDGSGNIYFADENNNVIRKVSPSGTISTVAGNGSMGYSGDGGAATLASLYAPVGVAVDSSGNLYIGDQVNNIIRKVSPSGTISTVAGNGSSSYSGDGGAATSASLANPVGVAVDGSGNLYIADYFNNRIRKVSPSGTISAVAGNGSHSYSGDGGAATSAGLFYPTGVAVDGSGNLYIADYVNGFIRKVSSGMLVSNIIGADSVCAGATTTYSSATGGGAWASSNAAIASVGADGVVTGVAAGTAIIGNYIQFYTKQATKMGTT